MMRLNTDSNEVPSKKDERMNEKGAQSLLLGYARRSKAGGALKLSIDLEQIQNVAPYTTSDGKQWAPLIININSIGEVMSGNRAVTAISSFSIKDDVDQKVV